MVTFSHFWGRGLGPIGQVCCWALTLGVFTARGENLPVDGIDYLRDVRPILASHCLKCHGPDEETRKARLRLDTREEAVQPAKSGERPIAPGHPEQSEVIRRIFTQDVDDLMPPPAAKNPLSDQQKEILKRWVADGAPYKTHWAWVKPVQAQLPGVRESNWPNNPIDNFVLNRMEKEGMKPSPVADKYTLVRRLYLDLIGLTPTLEQSDAFVNDTAPGAYERLVDQLLASPQYGERWARRWLDLARYADTNGYEKDRPRSIWPWRDWVIQALNADMPFDQFTIKQLAGDMLPQASDADRIATGFNRNTMLNEEGGIDPLEFRFYSMVDRVHVTATTWMGLTMQCAQCHTHKFDPIQQKEYYQFMAFLNDCDEPTMPVDQPDLVARRRSIQERIDRLQASLVDSFPAELRVDWLTPADIQFASPNGAEGERLSDGSFRIEGKAPDKDTYTLQFKTSLPRITHVQLEVAPDERLAKSGPGRGDQGDFVLSELELKVQTNALSQESRSIKIASATASSEREGHEARNSIDGKSDTGWSVNAESGRRFPAHIVFALAEPLVLDSTTAVSLSLVQEAGAHRTLGHFRVSLGNEVPDARPLAERQRLNRDRHFAKWLQTEVSKAVPWRRLHPVEATSGAPSLDVEEDDTVFASGDFTKSDTYTLRFRDLPPGVKAIRLEALADERLPGGGPGRVYYEGEEGDFFLSDFKVMADGKAVALTNATESFARDQDTAAKAIDQDLQSGWSIRGRQGQTQNAVFAFAEPLTSTNELKVDLTFERYYASALGRLRIWVTTAEGTRATALPNALNDLLLKYRSSGVQALIEPEKAAADRQRLLEYYLTIAPELGELRREMAKLRSEMPKLPTTLVMRARSAAHPRVTHVHHRGEFLQTKEAVTPGVPSFLPPLPPDAPRNRVGFARWLVSEENPLTARVFVNRQWEALFGRGLVRTTEDVGFQGDLPSHPELLDWLAVEFMRQGWSQKKLHRLMVLSATYRQSSNLTPDLLQRDPQNILLARGPRFRIEAETVRDAALQVSGLLSDKIGGPSVFPPQPPGVTTEGAYGALTWSVSQGPDRYRRGLYTFAKRTAPYAMTLTFDGPSGEACLARRDRSNTPLQALTLLNDTVFMECARALGRWAVQSEGSVESRVDKLFQRCLTRPPSSDERARLAQFFETQLNRLKQGELKPADLLAESASTQPNEEAAWTAVARVLLNLDEMITKG